MKRCSDCAKSETCKSRKGSHENCFAAKPRSLWDWLVGLNVEDGARQLVWNAHIGLMWLVYFSLDGSTHASKESAVNRNIEILNSPYDGGKAQGDE